jgi:PIN domain nuclease of toxin-antitoxin system
VTRYLLDTNAALLALSDPAALSAGARRAIIAGPNVLSTVVYWEVILKTMKGALRVGDPRVWWVDALEQLAATPAVFKPEHVSEIYTLPPVHKDPFDRALIAQAIVEDLTLVTTDEEIPKYASGRFRVLR